MSYKTNPVANRLSINKGFRNTYFVNNKTAYSNNLILWLSLYLFLKSYLAFKNIRLLSCEIRVISQTHKCLFISFLKKSKKIKNKKYKNIYLSRMNQINNKNAMYLLYKNINNLKKLYIIGKQKPYRNLRIYYKKIKDILTIYKKRKIFNWLKTKKIKATRSYQISYRNKLTTNSFNIFFLKKKDLQIKNIINQVNEFKKLSKFFINNKNINNIWFNAWIREKLKKIKRSKKKVKFFFFLKHKEFMRAHRSHLSYYKRQLWKNLWIDTFYLKQLRVRRNRFLGNNGLYFLTKQNYINWKLLHRHKLYLHYFMFYKKQNKNLFGFILYNLRRLSRKKFNKQNQRLLLKNVKKKINLHFKLIRKLFMPIAKKRTLKRKILLYWYLYLLKYNMKKKKYLRKIKKNIKWIYWKNNKLKLSKIKFFFNKNKSKINLFFNNKRIKIKRGHIYKMKSQLKRKSYIGSRTKINLLLKWKKRLLIIVNKKRRFGQRKKFSKRKKKNFLLGKHKKKRRAIKSQLKSKNVLANKIYVKNDMRSEYFQNKTQHTSLQLQLILEKIISKFFHVSLTVKLINTSMLFNNKKIFFDIFQKKRRKSKLKKFRTLFIKSTKFPRNKSLWKKSNFNIFKIDNIAIKKYIENKEKTKENFLVGEKHKILGKSFFALFYHRKYLDAQLLADEISNLLRKRKTHTTIFNTLRTVADAFPQSSLISYCIIVTGKINSKNRAERLFVAQGHIPIQTFSERINFGLSQAKTPTGTFGIRVWIHF